MDMRKPVAVAVAAAAMLCATSPAAWADSVRDQQWHLKFLNMPAAQQISQGAGVKVGLPDTGVDAHDPELTGVVTDGIDYGLVPGDGRTDTNGHGTAMAGLIAGRGRGSGSESGVLGIAPKSSILSAKTLFGNLGGLTGDPALLGKGISWAVKHGANVICIAAGTSPDPTVKAAVDTALKAGVVVVAAAGNSPSEPVAFPANIAGVLAVSGINQDGTRADFSSGGPEIMIAAPGGQVVSTGIENQYHKGSGTSEASAIEAGVEALVRAKYPNLSGPEVEHRLTATATDKGAPGRDPEYGYGIGDPVRALTADVPPLPASPTADATSSAAPGRTGVSGKAGPPAENRSLAVPIVVGAGIVVLVGAIIAVLALRRRRPGA